MKNYIAGRACKLGGVNYRVGDTISAGCIEPKRIPTLRRAGIIIETDRRATKKRKADDFDGELQLRSS